MWTKIIQNTVNYNEYGKPSWIYPANEYSGEKTIDLTTPTGHDLVFEGLAVDLAGKNLVFFMGAGCSVDSGIPQGKDLKKLLLDTFPSIIQTYNLGETDKISLEKVADCCSEAVGRQTMIDSLNLFRWRGAAPNNAHKILAKLARENLIHIIITTNWDELIENAMDDFKVQPCKVVRFRDEMPGTTAGVMVLKAHGCVSRENRILITSQDLTDWDSDWIREFIKTTLRQGKSVFIGISGEQPIISSTVEPVLRELEPQQYPPVWVTPNALSPIAEAILEQATAPSNHLPYTADSFLTKLQANWYRRKIDILTIKTAEEILSPHFTTEPIKSQLEAKIKWVGEQLKSKTPSDLIGHLQTYAGKLDDPYFPMTGNEESLVMLIFWLAFVSYAFDQFKEPVRNLILFKRGFHIFSATPDRPAVNLLMINCSYYRDCLSYFRSLISMRYIGSYFVKPPRRYLAKPHATLVLAVGRSEIEKEFSFQVSRGETYTPILVPERKLWEVIISQGPSKGVDLLEKELNQWTNNL